MSVEITEGKPVKLCLPTPVTLRSPDASRKPLSRLVSYLCQQLKALSGKEKNENTRVWTNGENLFFLLHFFLPFLKEVEIVLSVVIKLTIRIYEK